MQEQEKQEERKELGRGDRSGDVLMREKKKKKTTTKSGKSSRWTTGDLWKNDLIKDTGMFWNLLKRRLGFLLVNQQEREKILDCTFGLQSTWCTHNAASSAR